MERRLRMDQGNLPQRASEWLVALLERPDDEALRGAFDRWLAAATANRADWHEIARAYGAIGRVEPAFRNRWASHAARRREPSRFTADLHGAVPATASGPAAPPSFSRWRRPAAGVAALAIAACVAFFALPDIFLRLQADHLTATAETRTVRLEDGSTVFLGPRSAIEVSYGEKARSLRLLRGVAYFDVVPQPARPFTVQANGVQATVLGTAFEMRRDADGADVALHHGSVRVENDGVEPPVTAVLNPGDWVRMSWNGDIRQGTSQPSQIGAWRRGQLIARHSTVGRVVDQIRKYYEGVVILRGDGLAEQPLTGVYNLTDPVTALKAVASAQSARIYQISPWVIVLSHD